MTIIIDSMIPVKYMMINKWTNNRGGNRTRLMSSYLKYQIQFSWAFFLWGSIKLFGNWGLSTDTCLFNSGRKCLWRPECIYMTSPIKSVHIYCLGKPKNYWISDNNVANIATFIWWRSKTSCFGMFFEKQFFVFFSAHDIPAS